jgi:molecular chaperone GrpE
MDEKEMTNQEKPEQNPEEQVFGLNSDENIAGTINVEGKVAEESEDEKLRMMLREKDDKYLRLYADFENFKRRNAKEKIELIQTAGKDVIQSLLEVLDDCDRAERQMQKSDNLTQLKEGVQLVFNKLRRSLHSRGLKEMSSIGEAFNPDIHEAITEIPVADRSMEGKIVDELEKGYSLNDKIIRFSKVVIGKQA